MNGIYKAGLKPSGPIALNWAPRWGYLLSTVPVHTTTHCRFHREHHWAPHLRSPALGIFIFWRKRGNQMQSSRFFLLNFCLNPRENTDILKWNIKNLKLSMYGRCIWFTNYSILIFYMFQMTGHRKIKKIYWLFLL